MALSDRAAAYGVRETNPLWASGISHDEVRYDLGIFNLGAKDDKGRFVITHIERLRLLTDSHTPFYDISYCIGRHIDGYLVRVSLGAPYDQFVKPRGRWDHRNSLRSQLIEVAKRTGRYAKGIGLLEADGSLGSVVSILR